MGAIGRVRPKGHVTPGSQYRQNLNFAKRKLVQIFLPNDLKSDVALQEKSYQSSQVQAITIARQNFYLL